MDVLGPLLDVVFPARCVGCGAAQGALCPACLARSRPPSASPADGAPPPGVDWWLAAFSYEGAVREALARVKYRNARSAVPVLAAVLVERLRSAAGGPIDVVTWPPTTAARRRDRGFDQAEHLARAVGAGLGVPVRPCLTRRAGASQTGRSAGERRRGPVFSAPPGALAGRAVLAVDDVATTGATLAAAARALRAAGAGAVAAATVARTPRRARSPPGGRSITARSRQSLRAPLSAVSRGQPPGGGPSSGGAEEAGMERTHPSAERHDVIDRLRRQVADGAYQPPVDELVNRLVTAVMAHRAAGPRGSSR